MQSQTTAQDTNFGRPGRQGEEGGNQPQEAGSNRVNKAGSMMSVFAGDQGKVNYIDKINSTVSFGVLGQLICIGIILTLISSLAAVIFVMRYEPLKILANRS